MATHTYFTSDGSFGEAIDGVICDTSNWTAGDWDEVESESPWDRASVARVITEQRGGRITWMVPIDATVQT